MTESEETTQPAELTSAMEEGREGAVPPPLTLDDVPAALHAAFLAMQSAKPKKARAKKSS